MGKSHHFTQLICLLLLLLISERLAIRTDTATCSSFTCILLFFSWFACCWCLLGRCGGIRCFLTVLLLEFFVHFDGLSVKLLIALDHEALKREKTVHRHYLINYLLVNGIGLCLLACLNELLVADAQLSHQFPK